MLKDAVSRWNDDIPLDMAEQAKKELKLLCGKLSKLPGLNASQIMLTDLANLHITTVKPEHFHILYVKFKDWLKERAELMITEEVKAILEHETIVQRSYSLLDGFQLSYSIHERSRPFGDPIVRDAQLALARMFPERLIAPSGALMLRDVRKVIHANPNQDRVNSMYMVLKDFYHFKRHEGIASHFLLECTPRSHCIDADIIRKIYSQDLSKFSVWDLMRSDAVKRFTWLESDENLSPKNILDKILGASVTSLSTVLSNIVSWLTFFQFEEDHIKSMLAARSGGMVIVEDIMHFNDPFTLFTRVGDRPNAKHLLCKDFKRLHHLIDLYNVWTTLGCRNDGPPRYSCVNSSPIAGCDSLDDVRSVQSDSSLGNLSSASAPPIDELENLSTDSSPSRAYPKLDCRGLDKWK
jgi:hypothetical protein